MNKYVIAFSLLAFSCGNNGDTKQSRESDGASGGTGVEDSPVEDSSVQEAGSDKAQAGSPVSGNQSAYGKTRA